MFRGSDREGPIMHGTRVEAAITCGAVVRERVSPAGAPALAVKPQKSEPPMNAIPVIALGATLAAIAYAWFNRRHRRFNPRHVSYLTAVR